MAPLIRAVLSVLVGPEEAKDIEIIANDVTVHPDGKWEIQFRHPSRCATHISLSRDVEACVLAIFYVADIRGYTAATGMTRARRSCRTARSLTHPPFSSSGTVSQARPQSVIYICST